jgi:hypothetical protein
MRFNEGKRRYKLISEISWQGKNMKKKQTAWLVLIWHRGRMSVEGLKNSRGMYIGSVQLEIP